MGKYNWLTFDELERRAYIKPEDTIVRDEIIRRALNGVLLTESEFDEALEQARRDNDADNERLGQINEDLEDQVDRLNKEVERLNDYIFDLEKENDELLKEVADLSGNYRIVGE